MTGSDALASTLHDFRAAAFALPFRPWHTLPAHTQEQWRRIADRLAPRLPDVTGKDCFDAWAHDMNATWEDQSDGMQFRWKRLALLMRQAAHRRAA